jgi:hypothetical protein
MLTRITHTPKDFFANRQIWKHISNVQLKYLRSFLQTREAALETFFLAASQGQKLADQGDTQQCCDEVDWPVVSIWVVDV